MGARRELVKGMLLGVVVGVAITVAFFQLRGEANISAAPKTSSDEAARMIDQLAQLRREREELVKRIAEAKRGASGPERFADHGGAYGPMPGPDADHGMSTSDDWWNKLPPNPEWDAPRKQLVLDRIAKLGVKLDAKQVECKRRCCRIALDDQTYDEHFEEIGSVGLDFEPPDGSGVVNAGSTYMITKCWRAGGEPLPDRLAERDALLAKVKPELDRCGQATSPAITLKLLLHVDTEGQLAKLDSNAKQLGQKAASCAETAVLQAAAFAPSPRNTEVPLTIVLGK